MLNSRGLLQAIIAAALVYSLPANAQQGPTQFSLSGGLYNSNGTPVTSSSVDFRIQILNPAGTCVLYSEIHNNEDLSTTKGGFALQIGTGASGVNNVAGGSALTSSVFENNGVTAVAGCAAQTFNSGDNRVIRVSYDLGSGFVAMNPDIPMTAAAYSMVAESVQGKRATDLVQIRNDNSTYYLGQSNIEWIFNNTNWPRLQALLNGNSSQYMVTSPTADVSFNNRKIINVAAPTANTDATNKQYVDGNIAGYGASLTGIGLGSGGGSTLVWDQVDNRWEIGTPVATDNTKLPLAGGTMTGGITMGGFDLYNVGHITMADQRLLRLGSYTSAQEGLLALGTANAGTMFFNSTTGQLRVWNGTDYSGIVPGGAAGGDLTGTYPNPTIANNAVTSGKINDGAIATADIGNSQITSAKINNTGIAVNRILITDATTGGTVTYATCAQDEILKFNSSTGWGCSTAASLIGTTTVTAGSYGSATSVATFTVDAQGRLTAAANTAITFPVTSVAGRTGAVTLNWADVGGLGSAATYTQGTGAGQIPALDGSARIPAVDGGLLTNVNAVRLQGRALSSAAPADLQVLQWNATLAQWEPSAIPSAPVSSVNGKTGVVTIELADIAGAGDITEVNTGNGLLGGVTSGIANISVNAGTGANQIVQLNANSFLPAIDGNLLTNLNAVRIQGRTVSSTAPTADQVLRWNNSTSQWEAQTLTDVGITALTGDVVASGSGSVASTISNNAISSAKINNTGIAVNRLLITDASTGATVTYASCAQDEIMKFNSSTGWGCAPDNNVTNAFVQGGNSFGMVATIGTNDVNRLDFETNNATRMSIDTTGNVGIGTATPVEKLEVNGNLRISGNNELHLGDSATRLERSGARIWAVASDGFDFDTFNGSAWGTRLRIDASGNVGIGTLSPNGSLHVFRNSGNVARFEANADNTVDVTGSTGSIKHTYSGTDTRYMLSSNGTVDFSLPVGNEGGALLLGSTSTANSPILSGRAQGIDFFMANERTTPQVRIDWQGKVGIGTTSPQVALDVAASGLSSAILVPRESSALRPTVGVNGMIRYNTSTAKFEAYESGAWVNMTAAGAGSGDFKADGTVPMTGAFRSIAGTVGAPGMTFVGDTDTGVWSPGANIMALSTGGTERVRLDSVGNLGIGTNAPLVNLHVEGATFNRVGSIVGNGLLTSAYGNSSGSAQQVTTDASSYYHAVYTGYGNHQWGTDIYFNKSRSTDGTTPAIVQNNDRLASFAIYADDGTGFNTAAGAIGFEVDGAPSAGDMPGRIVFSTTKDGSAFPTEKMRITSAGNVGIGISSPTTGALLDINGTGAAFSSLIVPRDSTALRPTTGVNGMIRYNTATARFEAFEGGSWVNMTAVGAGTGDFKADGTVPMTGAFRSIAGTAAAPGMTFVGDTDSGVYSPSANSVAISTSGTQRLSVDGSGNVDVNGAVITRETSSGLGVRMYTTDGGGYPVLNFMRTDNSGIVYINTPSHIAFTGGDVITDGDILVGNNKGVYGNGTGNLTLGSGTGGSAYLAFQTGGPSGTERMRIDPNGQIGVGTTSPGALVDVVGDTNPSMRIKATGTNSNALLNFVSRLSSADRSSSIYTDWGGNFVVSPANGQMAINAVNNGGATLSVGGSMIVGSGFSSSFPAANTMLVQGGVGIGSPSITAGSILDVNGSGTSYSSLIVPRDTTALRPTGVNGMIRYNTSTAKFEAYENGAWVNVTAAGAGSGDFKADGTVPMTGAFRSIAGTAAAPGMTFVGDTDTGVYSPIANSLAFSTFGTQRLTIDDGGRVGIGVSSPAYNLDVAGNARIDSAWDSALYIGGVGETNAYNSIEIYSGYSANPSWSLSQLTGKGAVLSSSLGRMTFSVGAGGGWREWGTTALTIDGVASSINNLNLKPSTTGNSVVLSTEGSDSNISLGILPKGTGFVGIGTSTPGAPLTISSSLVTSPSGLRIDNTNSTNNYQIWGGTPGNADGWMKFGINPANQNDYQVAFNSGGIFLPNGKNIGLNTTGAIVSNDGGSNFALSFNGGAYTYLRSGTYLALQSGGGNERLRIDSTGNIGIGTPTVTAGARIDIVGTGTADSSIIIPRATTSDRPTVGVNGMIRYNTTTEKFEVFEGVWQNMITAQSAPTFPLLATPVGSASAPAYSFTGDANTGMYQAAGEELAFSTFGSERLRITGSGNVGIGVAAPTADLQIQKKANPSALRIDHSGTLGGGDPAISVVQSATSNGITSMFISRGRNDGMGVVGYGTTGVALSASTPEWYAGLIQNPGVGAGYNYGIYEATAGNSLGDDGAGGTVSVRFAMEPGGNIYLGNGVRAAAPSGTNLGATGGFGTDIQGADLNLAGGRSTGNLAGGAIRFMTSDAGASGATMRTLTTKMIINGTGQVGIGTSTPTVGALLDVNGTGVGFSSMIVPRDTTALRPTVGVNGMIRFNTTTQKFEAYEGVWQNMIGGSGSVSFPLLSTSDGTAAAPAYSFNGDADNGMYKPNTNQLAFSTFGTERLIIDGSGNMGFGGISPVAKFTFFGNSDGNGFGPVVVRPMNDSMPAASVSFQGSAFTGGRTYNVGALGPASGIGAGGFAIFDYTNNVWMMTMDANNRIGLGSSATTAGARLDISGTGTAYSSMIVPRDTTALRPTTGVNGMIRYNTTTNKFEVYEGLWQNMITPPGAPAFPLLSTSDGTAAAPVYSFSSDSDTGMYRSGGNQLSFSTFGTERLYISGSGMVGIGTNAPTQALDVAGVSRAFYFVSRNTTQSAFEQITPADTLQPVLDLRRTRSDATQPGVGMYGYIGLAAEGSANGSTANVGSIMWGWENAQSNATTDRDGFLAFKTVLDNGNSATGGDERMRINSQGQVGIGTTSLTAGSILDIVGTGAAYSSIIVPRETTALRPTTAVNGMIRYNTSTNKFEGYANDTWSNLSGDLRTCMIIIGADNGAVLGNADIAPQGAQCYIPANATLLEINVRADTGTPNVIVERFRPTGSAVADLTSAALATGASGASACARASTSQTCLDGTTSSGTVTLTNTTLNAGDWIQTRTATAGGVAKRMSIAVVFTVN